MVRLVAVLREIGRSPGHRPLVSPLFNCLCPASRVAGRDLPRRGPRGPCPAGAPDQAGESRSGGGSLRDEQRRRRRGSRGSCGRGTALPGEWANGRGDAGSSRENGPEPPVGSLSRREGRGPSGLRFRRRRRIFGRLRRRGPLRPPPTPEDPNRAEAETHGERFSQDFPSESDHAAARPALARPGPAAVAPLPRATPPPYLVRAASPYRRAGRGRGVPADRTEGCAGLREGERQTRRDFRPQLHQSRGAEDFPCPPWAQPSCGGYPIWGPAIMQVSKSISRATPGALETSRRSWFMGPVPVSHFLTGSYRS